MKYLLMVSLIVSLFAAAGCEKALFPEQLPRTQYERFDRLRGRYTPARTDDPYGAERPALRDRLNPYRF